MLDYVGDGIDTTCFSGEAMLWSVGSLNEGPRVFAPYRPV